jgi:hypothetical protein
VQLVENRKFHGKCTTINASLIFLLQMECKNAMVLIRSILNKYSAKMERNIIKKMNDEATGNQGER